MSNANGSDPRAEALAAIERGWSVYACRPRTKVPRTPHGFNDATTEREQVLTWWRETPEASVGIATGAVSGLVVVDIDPRHGGEETLRDLIAAHGDIPATVESLTGGGGRHLFFQHPGGDIKSRDSALGRGVDVRADRGGIIAPPSVHKSGNRYAWREGRRPDEIELAPMPHWLLAMLGTCGESGSEGAGDCCISCVSESLGVCDSAPLSLCVTTVEEAIQLTLAEVPGHRNSRGFAFARALKAMPAYADANVSDLREPARRWYEASKPHMSGEHDFAEVWAELVYAWPRVKYPRGTGPMAETMKRAEASNPPAIAEAYGNETVSRLIRLCRELQRNAGDKPFFIAYRTIAELLGINRNRAGQFVEMLIADDVLVLVRKGHTGRASEYRYLGD